MGLISIKQKIKSSKKKFCICPSYTFAGTPTSIILAGLEPIFVDVEYGSGNLTPDILLKNFGDDFSEIAAVMPVSCFGTKLNMKDWDNFSKTYSVDIISDQAWCYDNFQDSEESFSVISLHCTKVLGCGEGGVLIVPDKSFKNLAIQISNFGFSDDKVSLVAGTNAKMSEYAAAVCHASIDEWDIVRSKNIALQERYIDGIKKIDNIELFNNLTNEWCWMSCVLRASSKNILKISDLLHKNNIESRVWWLNGCHDFPAFKSYKAADLKNTKKLAKEVLNIPFHIDLSESDVENIVSVINQEHYI